MARLPIPIAGPTYTNRSMPVSSQVTSNFYVEVNQYGNEQVCLMPFPGLKPFATSSGRGRGIIEHAGGLYSVSGGNLYRVYADATTDNLGAIDGSGICGLTTDGNNITIATGASLPYTSDGITITKGTDADLHTSKTATFINSRIVYEGSSNDILFADLLDPLTINTKNIIAAESKPDDMIAVYAYKQQLYAFGEKTIQPMYFTGAGDPPYDFVLNATQEVGLAAAHSVSSNNSACYFLGSDRQVYQLSGLNIRPISNPAIGQEIAGYSDVSDAYGICFNVDTSNFYLISFPTANKSWLYNETSGLWTTLSYGLSGDRHLISGYAYAYGKHLVQDRRNGNIYELDVDTYTDNGDPIKRQRDTISINGGTFGAPGAHVFMSRLGLRIEPGVSLATGEATINMQFSDDNGKTWSQKHAATIGEQGDFDYELVWYQLGKFKHRMFRFTMDDPVKWVLISAWADVEIGVG